MNTPSLPLNHNPRTTMADKIEMPHTEPDPRIPPDVQERIIDHLHDDRSALLSTRRVSSFWLACTRRWLTHNVTVDGRDAIAKNKILITLLQAPFSTLGPDIRSLKINGPDYRCGILCKRVHLGDLSSYRDLSAALEVALPYMTNLSALKLMALHIPCLSSRAQEAIVGLPPIKALDAFAITYASIKESLAPFQHISDLKIRHMNILGWREIRELHRHLDSSPILSLRYALRGQPDLPKLSCLSLVTSLKLLVTEVTVPLLAHDKYLHAQNMTKLSFTTLSDDLYSVQNIGAFIKAAGATLEHLHLAINYTSRDNGKTRTFLTTASPHSFPDSEFPISLMENTNLLTFHISSEHFSNDASWLKEIIATVSPTTCVKIKTWLSLSQPRNEVKTIKDFSCAEIEAFFSQYPGNDLSLHLVPIKYDGVDLQFFEDGIKNMIPKTINQGLVHLDDFEDWASDEEVCVCTNRDGSFIDCTLRTELEMPEKLLHTILLARCHDEFHPNAFIVHRHLINCNNT
ncbi:hypothetical protein H0H87_011144 [Tephrocybe sp. NHM501043]|nr:hypothetical protein H0H87_011144 [Tephrocybe sp. NHM501043]